MWILLNSYDDFNNQNHSVHDDSVIFIEHEEQDDEDNYKDENDEEDLDYEIKIQPKDVEDEKKQTISFKVTLKNLIKDCKNWRNSSQKDPSIISMDVKSKWKKKLKLVRQPKLKLVPINLQEQL